MMLYMHTFTPIDDPSVGGYFMDGLASESFGLLGWGCPMEVCGAVVTPKTIENGRSWYTSRTISNLYIVYIYA